jgi:polysaccharide export outer membrane protein
MTAAAGRDAPSPPRRSPRPITPRALIRRLLALLVLIAAPLAATLLSVTPAQARYAIQPGDTLQIEVLEDASLNRTVLVLPDGTISFPYAGTLHVAGQTVETLQAALTKAIAPNYAARPTVTVAIAALAPANPNADTARSLSVCLMGEVAKPGCFDVPRGTTLLQAIAEAGGPTKFAADKRIELHRHNPQTGEDTTYTFALSTNKPNKPNPIPTTTELAKGDVIVIPTRRLFE